MSSYQYTLFPKSTLDLYGNSSKPASGVYFNALM